MASPTDYINTVQSMYLSYYGRFADQAGLNYWTYMLNANGGNLDTIIQAFGTSAEATALYPATLSTAQKVTNLYNSLFGRDPDAAGLVFYTNLIGSGQATLIDIAKRVFDGATAEDANRLANKVNAANTLTNTVGASTNYSGDAAAATARALMNNITNDPATITTVTNVMNAAVTQAKTTGTAITTMAAATTVAQNSSTTTATTTLTAANASVLDGYSSFGSNNLTVTDAAGTDINASVLSSIGGKTTGTVTVNNAIDIVNGDVNAVTAALVTAATKVTAATATVTFATTATTTSAALKAIDATTTGAIDASNVQAITGLAAADFATIGGTGVAGTGGVMKTKSDVAISFSDTISAANVNTVLGLTTGVVTATVTAGTAASLNTALANAAATDALTLTLTDTTAAAATITALDGKTSVSVNAGTVTTVTGTVAEVVAYAAEVTAGTVTHANWSSTPTGGTVTVAQANAIDAANGTGILTASIDTTSTVASLKTLTATGAVNAYTIVVAAGDATSAAADLTTIDSITTVAVGATNVTTVTGTASQIAAYAAAETLGTITAAANYAATASDSTVTATVLNTIDDANGSGTITTTNGGGWSITGLNGLSVAATGSVDSFIFAAGDTNVNISSFNTSGDILDLFGAGQVINAALSAGTFAAVFNDGIDSSLDLSVNNIGGVINTSGTLATTDVVIVSGLTTPTDGTADKVGIADGGSAIVAVSNSTTGTSMNLYLVSDSDGNATNGTITASVTLIGTVAIDSFANITAADFA